MAFIFSYSLCRTISELNRNDEQEKTLVFLSTALPQASPHASEMHFSLQCFPVLPETLDEG